jgi:CRISPR/Cas system CMR-associated protein Cmr1 (group 7 of RAMP superfamily)
MSIVYKKCDNCDKVVEEEYIATAHMKDISYDMFFNICDDCCKELDIIALSVDKMLRTRIPLTKTDYETLENQGWLFIAFEGSKVLEFLRRRANKLFKEFDELRKMITRLEGD